MTRYFQVHQGKQLVQKNGEFVCGGGERVAADHPAVLALDEPEFIGRFGDDAPAQESAPAAPEAAPVKATTRRFDATHQHQAAPKHRSEPDA